MSQILEEIAASRVINATGTMTRLGDGAMDDAVVAAMSRAASWSVDIAELQALASVHIARATGAETGIVTAGAMAGLLVGSAACIAGLDPAIMARLPDTEGLRNEFVVARSHRNSYDHGVRAAGARLIEVGLPDRATGCGVRDTELWEIAAAIGDRTAGVLWLARPDARPSLASVVRVAHAAGVPVLVDAATELPPAHNLRRFIDEGADLVVFSGGKSLGGPSASGLLCGRRTLVASALLQQLDLDYRYEEWHPPAALIDKRALGAVPRHGLGRGCKVGKEQIVGLLVALERFLGEGEAARNARLTALIDALAAALGSLAGIAIRRTSDTAHGGLPLLEVRLAPPLSLDAERLAARLRAQRPSVHVDDTAADQGVLMLVPTCLAAADVAPIRAAFAAALGALG